MRSLKMRTATLAFAVAVPLREMPLSDEVPERLSSET
jgi:hypothetical protein